MRIVLTHADTYLSRRISHLRALMQVLWVAYTRDQDDLQWLTEVLLPSEPKFYTTVGFQEGKSQLRVTHLLPNCPHCSQVCLLAPKCACRLHCNHAGLVPLTAEHAQEVSARDAC